MTRVVPTASGEASKLKVKSRLNIHGIFNIVTATLYEKLVEPPEPEGNGKEKEVEGMDDKASGKAPEDMEKSAGAEGTNASQRQDSQDADSLMEAEGQVEAGAPSKEEGNESSQPPEQEQKAAAEGETQPPQEPPAKNGAQSSGDKDAAAKKKKKTVKAIDLPVSAFTYSASREQLDGAREEEVCVCVDRRWLNVL